jgi:hypothetical protein
MTRTRKAETEPSEEQPLPDPRKKREHLERSKRQRRTLKGLLEKEQEILANKEHSAEKTRDRVRNMLKSPLILHEEE